MNEKSLSVCLIIALVGPVALIGCDDEDEVDDVDTGDAVTDVADAADAEVGPTADARDVSDAPDAPEDGQAVREVDCEEVEADREISIVDFDFEPQMATVDTGAVVQWTNDGDEAHTTTSGGPGGGSVGVLWDSGNMEPGETFCAEFLETDTYAYFCSVHPEQMQATLTVE